MTMAWILLAVGFAGWGAGCGPALDGEEIDLGMLGGKDDSMLSCREVSVDPGATKRFRVRAASLRVQFTPAGESEVPAQLSAKNYDIDVAGEVSTTPEVVVRVDDDEMRNWTIRLHNLSDSDMLQGEVCAWALSGEQPLDPSRIPTLDDPVQYQNEYCTYADTIPYLRSVAWEHPLIQAAMRALAPGWRSTFTYRDWSVPYDLEYVSSSMSETEQRNRTVRNWIRVVCGEHRDYPAMIQKKLELAAEAHFVARAGEMREVDTSRNLFSQITYGAYRKMSAVMGAVHRYRQQQLNQDAGDTGYHYGFRDTSHETNREAHSVPPWTHCEMKYMFERHMTADAPSYPDAAEYVRGYESYQEESCTAEDFEWMYNFRGHRNFMPLWLESNAFVWNSRRARWADSSRGDSSYYLRPFASRYTRSRQAWATFLLYPEADHEQFITASESEGGHIVYVTDQDLDGDNLADYRLFGDWGCGDQGVAGSNPDTNCNMVPWSVAAATPNTTGHVSTWDPSWWKLADFGFMQAVTAFEDRMARFNQGLDRHTNWGPTGFYVIDGAEVDRPKYIGAHSPIVAASYDISASDYFAHRDLPSTHEYERGRLKWMYFMRFRASDYYDEQDMRTGREMDFDRMYFNETSLSNDYYRERALDRFGWVPNSDMYANVYFVYADHGDEPPVPEDIPAP